MSPKEKNVEAAEPAIEKGIPMPETKTEKTSRPYAKLEVGDSFMLPVAQGSTAEKLKANLSSSARNAGKKLGVKFAVRIVEGGVRVWRTA
jgi:hypothetical protein